MPKRATLTCAGLTAWRALFVDYALKPGDTVLVQGTGGVSIFALQFARAAGATVIATSSSDEKLQRVEAMGADHLINYKDVEAWGPKALEITGGRGVDCVVEIGGAGTLDQSMLATRVGRSHRIDRRTRRLRRPGSDGGALFQEPHRSGADRGQSPDAAGHDRRDRGEWNQAGPSATRSLSRSSPRRSTHQESGGTFRKDRDRDLGLGSRSPWQGPPCPPPCAQRHRERRRDPVCARS